MKTRILGKNGPALSEIGFGAWAIGGPWEFGWGKVNDGQSVKAVHKAIDLGINWIDTAAIYGLGHSEEVVGKALAEKRNKIFLATKCGMVWDDQRQVKIHASPKSIMREIDNSLKRLQTDYVDLYQIHWPDPETPVEESWSTLVQIQKEGKARYIGVCNYDRAMLEKCHSIHPVQSLQSPYSLVRRQLEKEILPFCLELDIGFLAYSPMQAGLLSGKFDITKIADDDWRRKNKYYQDPFLSKALTFVDRLKSIAAAYGRTAGQISVAWVLHHPATTSAIVGARSEPQVEENVLGSGIDISSNDIIEIEHILSSILGNE